MKVSIIIPVYNMEKRLQKCLDSIINQTYKNIEIIIINDGSADNSLNILKEYSKKDERIILIDQKNQGISAARNKGLEVATGDFIAFVDSDDYVELNMIGDLLDKSLSEKSDIVVCDYYMFDENNRTVKSEGYADLFGSSIYDRPQIICDINFAPWNKLYKKELFSHILFPVKTKYEDFEAILKVFSKAQKIVKLNKPLYDYYINMSGETRLGSIKNMDMLAIAKNLNNYFDFNGKDKVLKNDFFMTMSEKLLNSAVSIFKICDTKTCLNYIDQVYLYLNSNCKEWKSLYRNNKIDTGYIKFIRGNKFFLKTYAFLRINMFKLSKQVGG